MKTGIPGLPVSRERAGGCLIQFRPGILSKLKRTAYRGTHDNGIYGDHGIGLLNCEPHF